MPVTVLWLTPRFWQLNVSMLHITWNNLVDRRAWAKQQFGAALF